MSKHSEAIRRMWTTAASVTYFDGLTVNLTPRMTERSWLLAASFAVAVLWGGSALAYRPFDSTDADVAKPLDLEFEFGPLDYLVIGRTSWLAPSLVVNLGIVPGMEFVLEGQQFIRLGPTGGLPRVSLQTTMFEVKTMLRNGSLQGGSGPSVAVEAGVLLPTVNAEPGVGGLVTFIVSQRFTAATLSLDGTVQLTRALNAEFDGGLILEGPDDWSVRPVGELLFGHEFHVATTFSGLVGAIWRLDENFSLDMGLRLGRTGNQTVGEIRAGLTWTIPLASASH